MRRLGCFIAMLFASRCSLCQSSPVVSSTFGFKVNGTAGGSHINMIIYSFGMWCVDRFVDDPFGLDPGWLVVLCPSAQTRIRVLRGLFDNKAALKAIEEFPENASVKQTTLSGALAFTYMVSNYYKFKEWVASPPIGLSSAIELLKSSAEGDSSRIRRDVACLALVKVLHGRRAKMSYCLKVLDDSKKEDSWLLLNATFARCALLQKSGEETLARRIGLSFVYEHPELRLWRRFMALKERHGLVGQSYLDNY